MTISRSAALNYINPQFEDFASMIGQKSLSDLPNGYRPDIDNALRELGFEESVLGGKLGCHAFDGTLGIDHLTGTDTGQVELDRQRFGEQLRIALGDACAATFAHANLDDAERFERTQRVAGYDSAYIIPGGEVLFGAEGVARFDAVLAYGAADVGDDRGGKRCGAAGKHGRSRHPKGADVGRHKRRFRWASGAATHFSLLTTVPHVAALNGRSIFKDDIFKADAPSTLIVALGLALAAALLRRDLGQWRGRVIGSA